MKISAQRYRENGGSQGKSRIAPSPPLEGAGGRIPLEGVGGRTTLEMLKIISQNTFGGNFTTKFLSIICVFEK